MKEARLVYLILFLALIICSCSHEFRDQEGHVFNTVLMGRQLWMSENLNVTHFRNGDSIPQADSVQEWLRMAVEHKPAWCFSLNDPGNGGKYGRLYNWFAVNDPRGIAPRGWHVAKDEEWGKMVNYFGGATATALKIRSSAPLLMAGKGKISEFTALASGARHVSGAFFGEGKCSYWWSGTEFTVQQSYMRMLDFVECNIKSLYYVKGFGFSVRCIKD